MPAAPFRIRLESPTFPGDDIQVSTLRGKETISRLFELTAEIVCFDRAAVDLRTLTGAAATLVFEREGAAERRVHGLIAAADDLLDGRGGFRTFRIVLVPRAHRLAMVQTQDVFVDQTVPEILAAKLAQVGLGADSEQRLLGEYPRRELTIQYGESDLAFVSRLAEHLGVSFFFEQRGESDVLVFTDHAEGFRPIEGAGRVPFHDRGEQRDVFSLQARSRVVPAYYAVREYDYRNPLLDLTVDHRLPSGSPGGVIEQGAHHDSPAEGRALARVRAEEQQAQQLFYAGASDRHEITAGARFTLEGHPEVDALDLLVVEVEHDAALPVAGTPGAATPVYRNTFRATPAGAAYRPPRTTPRPRLAGLFSGIVDADQGGAQAEGPPRYAPVDEQGRYRVRFLFDTTPGGQRAASCPIRMIQGHAGENYGIHFPLRAGVEVLVGFVEGDPDRPVIVGAAPNPLKPSPVTRSNAGAHVIRTGTGISLKIVEDW